MEQFVLIFAISVSYHNGYVTTKISLWKNVLSCTVRVVFAVRNSRVGWFEKALKMLDNYTVVLQHMEKIRKFKVNFGMVRCMFLMIVSRCQLIMLIQLSLVKIILMEHLVNVMSIVQIRFVTNKFLLQKKTKQSMFEDARLNVVHMNVIAMCKKMVYHVKNGQNV
ncbi:hypothetical protein A8G17_33685 [Escherichia coli]|nr:hypothetical protein A8G17_33685 [Escherichia coli]